MLWLLAACGSTPEPPAPAETVEGPRTVVVVIGCTLRADRMGAYGNPRDTTPYFDALAAQGALFEQTLANAPWTRPAIASLLTGRYPLSLGIDDERDKVNTNRGLHPDAVTLAERFSTAGWKTVGGTANPNANAVFNMTQGFDGYHEGSGLWREEMTKVPGVTLTNEVLKLAEEYPEDDLYIQIVVIDTHKPLPNGTSFPIQFGLETAMNPGALGRYDAALGYFDDTLVQLDEGLAKQGRDGRTLVVIGDHGEGLHTPEWALKSHGRRLYDANIHVPWLITGPGIAEGHRVTGLSEGVDLVPTLAELYGLETGDVHGDSRAPQVRGELAETQETAVFSETFYATEHHARYTTPEWTFIRNFSTTDRGGPDRGDYEIYAAKDGEQAVPLVAKDAKEAMRALELEMEALRTVVGANPLVWEGEALTDDLEAQLKGLGYVED
jgi:arylsulfatase A-like enzyme